MSSDLKNIDPETAWKVFTPSEQQPWTRQLAAHLYRRAGFAASQADLVAALKTSPAELVDRLVNAEPSDESDKFVGEMEQVGKLILSGREPKRLAAWWLYRMTFCERQLLEKATFFWHGHFATSAAKVNNVAAMLKQNELLREHALGSFEELVQGISRDPAMLIYLDSTQNRKTHPNENYAREVLELFCLGLGNYTEKDIQEIARCFTGWEVKRGGFRFNQYQHDDGVKRFLGVSGKLGGAEAVKAIVKQPAAARFIARKLVKFYLFDEPVASDELIQPLADQLTGNGFHIGEVVQTILSSQLCFSPHALNRKIRSPVELAIGLLRTTGTSVNFFQLSDQLELLGQLPFYPPNVKGWDGGRSWINSSTLIARSNLVSRIVRSPDTTWADGDPAQWLRLRSGSADVGKQVDWLLDMLVAQPVKSASRDELVQLAAELKTDRPQGVADLICAISALPEFQLN